MIVVPTLHPAFLLRASDGEQGEARFRWVVEEDFRKALKFRYRRPHWDERIIWKQDHAGRYVNLYPTAEEVEQFALAVRGTHTAVDVETTGNTPMDCRLICVGLASENGLALCIPFLRQGGHAYWSPADEKRVRAALAWLLADLGTPKVFHNGAFDTVVLWAHGLPVAGWAEDTMLGHHAADAEMPHALSFLGSMLLEHPYWKDDVKGGEGWLDQPDERLRSYNLRDCLVTIRSLPAILAEIARWGVTEVYRNSIILAQIMCRATIRGVEVDVSRRYWIYRELARQREKALRTLRRLSGDPEFNPSSTAQMRRFLFSTMNFPVLRRTEKVNQETGEGNPSTDKKAMALLAVYADSLAQKEALLGLASFRKVDKLIGTYTGNFNADPEKYKPGLRMLLHPPKRPGQPPSYRVHAVWKQLVVTGRFASSPNMQNLMTLIKRMFRAGAGRVIIAVDLSQAELRVIAYFADDKDLQEAYRLGLNLHTINTTLIFGVRSPGVDTNEQTEEYLREAVPRLMDGGPEYESLPIVGEAILACPICQDKEIGPSKCPTHVAELGLWTDSRRLTKEIVFGDNYNASAETLYETAKAKRDKKTDEPLFPDLTLADVEAGKAQWEGLHPPIVRYWDRIDVHARRQGYLRGPISLRVRRFRAGFKKTEEINWPIQEGVAAHMNAATIRIAGRLYRETSDDAQVIIQVHDALYIDAAIEHTDTVKRILVEELSKKFRLEPFPGLVFEDAVLPPDKPKTAQYLDAL